MDINPEGLIPILGGMYALLLAYGLVPAGKDPVKSEEMKKRVGPLLKRISPVVIVFGLLLFFRIL